MDILRFVNSKDIRKHLADIGYEFNSLQAAWLIYQCQNATIEEKHKAWTELIDTMPDCSIEERRNTAAQSSLHAFLQKYMEIEDKLIDDFRNDFWDEKHADRFADEKPFVYRFKYICKDGSEYDMFDAVFSSFDIIYESIMEPEEDVVRIKCIKTQVDRVERWHQIAFLTPSFDFLKIDPGHIVNDEECDLYWGVFDGLWFDFPTPFKIGDIVWNPEKPDGLCGGPFVLTDINLEKIEKEQWKERIRQNGDASDMNARGYFLCDDGNVYYEVMWNYMDLEFDEKELTGSQRTLTALSSFLKGKVDPGLFARAYHQIIMDGFLQKSFPEDRSEAELILAGVKTEGE